ncbi:MULTISPECIES: hypothetical protein [unclassified Microcoleus]|uniref:hypothetical protein n=1 Tax=unclassified Microcoleus TaxID=2642155 RepID=UPI002FD59765
MSYKLESHDFRRSDILHYYQEQARRPVPQTQKVSFLVGWAGEPARPRLIENAARCAIVSHLPPVSRLSPPIFGLSPSQGKVFELRAVARHKSLSGFDRLQPLLRDNYSDFFICEILTEKTQARAQI